MPVTLMSSLVNNQRGISLSEVLVSVVLLSLVGAATATLITGTFNSVGYQSRMVDAQLDVGTAFALLQDDLRAAGYIVDGVTQPIFQELVAGTQADSISFVGDVNADNLSERITYALVEGKLMRTQEVWSDLGGWTAATPQPVAAGVTAFTLEFYRVDPCTAAITKQTAAEVLAAGATTYIAIHLTGSGTYKERVVTRTFTGDVGVRQANVLPTCS
jgi:type II secretory pathway component PulJ